MSDEQATGAASTEAPKAAPKETVVQKESVFRGNWQPTLYKPVFGQYQFLPTPIPQEPKKKVVVDENKPEPVKEEPESPKKKVRDSAEIEPRQRFLRPPEDIDVLFKIIDREKDYRACIATDGTCYNNMGDIIGYLSVTSYEVGSASEMYLGCLVENQFDNVAQVRDYDDELVGYLDLGTHTIRDRQGGTVADFESGGIVKHSNGTYLGQFEGARGYHNMREISLYLMLLDPGMCSDVSG